MGSDTNLIPLLCSIFLANQGAGEATEVLSMVSKYVHESSSLFVVLVIRNQVQDDTNCMLSYATG